MMSWARVRRIRQVVQILFFCLFIVLLFVGAGKQIIPPIVALFFRFNPLSSIATMLANRQWIPQLGFGIITVVLTWVVGRFWCGWICPLGSLLEWIPFKQVRQPARSLPNSLRRLKYILLLLILIAALLANTTLLNLDPLAIFTRTMTVAIIPAIIYGFNSAEMLLYRIPAMSSTLDRVDAWLRGSVIPFEQPAFTQVWLIVAIFVGILLLNSLAYRFWCRYLCPLGALLGWLSKISLFRPMIGSACNRCTRCVTLCQPGAIVTHADQRFFIQASECTVCLDCLVGCKQGEIRFRAVQKLELNPEIDLSRRQALSTMVLGAAGTLLLGIEIATRKAQPSFIRPPGVINEDDFQSRCLRCAQCMKICPTTALQPALFEAGLIALWTPLLVPRVGYCDYGCNACGQICPSAAIPSLSLNQKRQQVLGKASVNESRCLPWSSNIPCIVCEEMCPVPEKAVKLDEVHVKAADGSELFLQRPRVVRELCIGCGICEHYCPLDGDAAIRVYSQ